MQALSLHNGLHYRRDQPKPEPAADEALISLRVAGICATDLELVKGYAGFSGILGHEFVGVVEQVHADQHRHWLKQRVVGSINIGCGHCDACLQENIEHCQQRKVLGIRGKDGVFADYFTLPIKNLIAVPDQISDDAAVFTEPLAAALRVAKQLAAYPDIHQVGVMGAGRLGMLIAKALAVQGYQVEVLARSTASLALPQQWQLDTRLIDEVGDNQFQCVVDATGSAAGFKQALRVLGPRGTLILKSTFSALEPMDLSKIVVYELNVIGSRCGPFADALALLQQQSIPVTTLIDGSYHLQDGINAFNHAGQKGVRKILLYP